MNKKIKQLAVEAGLYVEVKGEPWPRNMAGEDIEGAYQRFAHLVVQECVEIADTAEPYKCGDLIKKHFGAEPDWQRYEFQEL